MKMLFARACLRYVVGLVFSLLQLTASVIVGEWKIALDSTATNCPVLSSFVPYSYSQSNVGIYQAERVNLFPTPSNVDAVRFPFHVAIKFWRSNDPIEHIFSGAIVKNDIIITSAPRISYFKELFRDGYKCAAIAGASSLRFQDIDNNRDVQVATCLPNPSVELRPYSGSDPYPKEFAITLILDQPFHYSDVVKPVCLFPAGYGNQLASSVTTDHSEAFMPVVVGFPTSMATRGNTRVIINSPKASHDKKLYICLRGTSLRTKVGCKNPEDFILLTTEINEGITNISSSLMPDPGRLLSVFLKVLPINNSTEKSDGNASWFGNYIELWIHRDSFAQPLHPTQSQIVAPNDHFLKLRINIEQKIYSQATKLSAIQNLCTAVPAAVNCPLKPNYQPYDPARLTQWSVAPVINKTPSCNAKDSFCWSLRQNQEIIKIGAPILVVRNNSWYMIGLVGDYHSSTRTSFSWRLDNGRFNTWMDLQELIRSQTKDTSAEKTDDKFTANTKI